jgi:hypothetical protein
MLIDDFLAARDAGQLREAGLRMTYPEQRGAFRGATRWSSSTWRDSTRWRRG